MVKCERPHTLLLTVTVLDALGAESSLGRTGHPIENDFTEAVYFLTIQGPD